MTPMFAGSLVSIRRGVPAPRDLRGFAAFRLVLPEHGNVRETWRHGAWVGFLGAVAGRVADEKQEAYSASNGDRSLMRASALRLLRVRDLLNDSIADNPLRQTVPYKFSQILQ